MTRVRFLAVSIYLAGICCAHAQGSRALLAGGNDGISIDYLRIGISLAFCLALAVVAAAILRKRSGRAIVHLAKGDRRIRVLETSRLSPRVQLHLVEVDGQSLLITVGPQNTHTVVLQKKQNEDDRHVTV